MVKYMIPDKYKNGFKIFLSLDRPLLDNLILEIEKSLGGMSPQKLPERLHGILGIAIDDLEELVSMLFSLYRAQDSSGVDVQEFADGILGAIKQDADLKVLMKEGTQERLRKALSVSGPFLLTLKAFEFANERERLTAETRIITDVRPIIGEENNLLGSIILHDLMIVYQEGEQMKKARFALDKTDLKQLREAIEKAEITEKIIREKFKSAENIFIEVD